MVFQMMTYYHMRREYVCIPKYVNWARHCLLFCFCSPIHTAHHLLYNLHNYAIRKLS